MEQLQSFVAGVLIATTVTVGWVRTHQPEQPYCPTEDSCVASYDNGEWHITEVQP